MARERLAAIIIGVIMIMSAAGFALNSAINQGRVSTTPEITVPAIVTRQLTTNEMVYVLNYQGKVIIEYSYLNNTQNSDVIASLEGFAQKRSDFIVLSEFPGNETSIKMIGSAGKIVDVGNMTLTDQNLLNAFCPIAIAQPPECLM